MVKIIQRKNMCFIVSNDNRIIYQAPSEYRISQEKNLIQELIHSEKLNNKIFEIKIYLTPDSFQLISLKDEVPEGTQIQFDERTGVLHHQEIRNSIIEHEKISLSSNHFLVVSLCIKYPDSKKITIQNNQEEVILEYQENQLKPIAFYKKDNHQQTISITPEQVDSLYNPFNYKYIPYIYPPCPVLSSEEMQKRMKDSIEKLTKKVQAIVNKESSSKKILKHQYCYKLYEPKKENI